MNSDALNLLKILNDEGFPSYLVGGCVRDIFLNVEPHDIDIATKARPNELKSIAHKHNIPIWFSENGLKHGTIVFKMENIEIEVTTFRKDVSCDGRNATIEFADTIEDDLSRRDFSFNSIALSSLNDKAIDPFNGIEDLKNGIVRFVGDANARISEDRLRMLRAVRFAVKYDFSLNELEVIQKRCEEVNFLSKERIRDEFLKILSVDIPSIGIRLLDKIGLLKQILPEVCELKGIEQREDYHHKDAYEHSLMVLDNMAYLISDPVLRLAALLHDIGKPITKSFTPGVGFQFLLHEVKGAKIAGEILNRLKFSLDDIHLVVELIKDHMRLTHLSEECSDKSIRRLLREIEDKNISDFLEKLIMISKSDITSHRPDKVVRAERKLNELIERIIFIKEETPVEKIVSPLSGTEIMEFLNLSPCKRVGECKDFLQNAVIDGVLLSGDKEKAYELLKEM